MNVNRLAKTDSKLATTTLRKVRRAADNSRFAKAGFRSSMKVKC